MRVGHPANNRYRCFLSNLAGLAAPPPPDSLEEMDIPESPALVKWQPPVFAKTQTGRHPALLMEHGSSDVPAKNALTFPLPLGVVQGLVRFFAQVIEAGPAIRVRGEPDGHRDRAGHIPISGKRRADPGQRALGGRPPAIIPHMNTNSSPPIREAMSAEPGLQDDHYLPEHGIPGAVAERSVDALKIVNIHNAEERRPVPAQKSGSAFWP